MQNPRDTVNSSRRLLQVQAASGLLFAVFLLLHLLNQMLATFGPGAYDGTQRALRRGYQAPPVEIALVLAPLLTHAAAGILRLWRRRSEGKRAPANIYARLHRISGIVLLIFFGGHVAATRGASLLYGVFPEFLGVAFTLKWVPAYFFPYYTVFALAGLYHLIYGLSVALPVLGLRGGSGLRKPALLVPAASVLGLFLVLGLLSQGGILRSVGHPEETPYARLVMRLAGKLF